MPEMSDLEFEAGWRWHCELQAADVNRVRQERGWPEIPFQYVPLPADVMHKEPRA